ncbi:hypothetical protein [Bartonella phoceensis]|uniref:hypothetical protein n=1 Tax=Bartonella phoceensis TaxID=270249 RepID=UPI001FEB9F42|nr:hypothetical protein [Bartonella phoceensis]
MNCTMFTQLFNYIDQATKTDVMDIISKAVSVIMFFTSTSLTVAFIVYGGLFSARQ